MKPTHVLIPIDFSETSLRALKYGMYVADTFSADMTLVHVLVQPAEELAVREAEQQLAELLPEPFDKKARLHAPLVSCTIEEELLRAVQTSSADLVILGTRGLRPFKRFFLGSKTEHLLRLMPVPLMTVSNIDEGREQPLSMRPSVKRIVYATDFSEPAETAFSAALEFARHLQSELEIVHVVEHLVLPLTVAQYGDSVQRGMIRHAEESLQQIIANEDVGEVSVESKVLQGRPWEAILHHVGETRADLIVISLHGMGFLERALLGTTAERVIRDSSVPVLGIPVK